MRSPAKGLRRPSAARTILLTCLFAVGLLVPAVVDAQADLDEQVRRIAAGLRCPVCQNLSVADSPSELAQEMRGVIREQLQAGRSPEEIRAYFLEKYGDWILLSPRPRGLSLLLWIGPFAAAAAGLVVAGMAIRRWARRPTRRGAGSRRSDAPRTGAPRGRDRRRPRRTGPRNAGIAPRCRAGAALRGAPRARLRPPRRQAVGRGPCGDATPSGPKPGATSSGRITGTVTLAPSLGARIAAGGTLFLIARRGEGPPLAVKRIAEPAFPLAFTLGSEDVMLRGRPFEGEVTLTARLKRDGTTGPAVSGDLEGATKAPVRVGQSEVQVVLDQVR